MPIILRSVGPALLRGGLGGLSGGGGGTTSSNGHDDDDDFDDDEGTNVKEGSDGSKVSVSLPTFPPDTDDDDDDDEGVTGNGTGNGAGNGAGNGSTSTSTGTSTGNSNPPETVTNGDSQNDINTDTGDQPNVSSNHEVMVEAIQMMEIDSGDQSTVKQPDTSTSRQSTTSSQSSSDDTQHATENPITLTGFNIDNAIPSTNLIYADASDESEIDKDALATTANPNDIYPLIDIRAGFDHLPNAPATLLSTSTGNPQNLGRPHSNRK